MKCRLSLVAFVVAVAALFLGVEPGKAQSPYYPDYYPTPTYSPGLRPFYPGYSYSPGSYYYPTYDPIYTGYNPGVYTGQDQNLRYFTVRRDITYYRRAPGSTYAAVPEVSGTAIVYAVTPPSANSREGIVAAEYSEDAQPTKGPAEITVGVPAGAEVWFGDHKTTQDGIVRQFRSPALEPGREYTYEIRAQWKDDGKDKNQTRQVTVRAATHLEVDFTVPQSERREPEKVPGPQPKAAPEKLPGPQPEAPQAGK